MHRDRSATVMQRQFSMTHATPSSRWRAGAGRAAIAVIRVSGPATRDVLEALCRRRARAAPGDLARASDPRHGALLDRGSGALVPRAGKLHRRGHGRVSAAWQPRRGRARDRCGAVASRHCASPSQASSRGAPSRTASSISTRSRASPISSMPRPRRRRAGARPGARASPARATRRGATTC